MDLNIYPTTALMCGASKEAAWLFNSHFRILDSRERGDLRCQQQDHVLKLFSSPGFRGSAQAFLGPEMSKLLNRKFL